MSMRHIRKKSNVSIFYFHEFIAALKMLSGYWYIGELWFCWLAARHSSKLRSAWLTRKAVLYGCPNFFVLHSKIFPDIDSSDSESAHDSKHQGQENT